MSNGAGLRIGIWVDEAQISKHQRDFVVWARSQPGVVLAALLVTPVTEHGSRFNPLRRALFKMMVGVQGMRLRRRGDRYREHRDRFDLTALVSAAPVPILSTSEKERLQRLHLDLIVFLGAEIPAAGAPVEARLGAVAFEDADPLHRHGRSAGFWEVLHQHDTTRFALKRFDAGRGGEVLLRGAIPTRHFYLLNEAALREKAYHYLRSLVLEAAASGRLPPSLRSRRAL
jgi:hypothetical protein